MAGQPPFLACLVKTTGERVGRACDSRKDRPCWPRDTPYVSWHLGR